MPLVFPAQVIPSCAIEQTFNKYLLEKLNLCDARIEKWTFCDQFFAHFPKKAAILAQSLDKRMQTI